MYLDKAEATTEPSFLDRCEIQPASWLTVHDAACCTAARAWFRAMAASFDLASATGHGLDGPRWIRDLYEWGPSRWPMSWCQLVRAKELDCGALSALAREVFTGRGLSAVPVALLQQFGEQDTLHWRRRWKLDAGGFDWLSDEIVYHEVCGVFRRPGELAVWDATHGMWIDPEASSGYGSTRSIRVLDVPHAVRWGRHELHAGRWHDVQAD